MLKEVFTDKNGKLSAKRVAFPMAFATAIIMMFLQGTGYFTTDITGLLQTLLLGCYGLLGISVAERRN